MRDPHVVSLEYRLVSEEGVSFKSDVPPVERSEQEFDLLLSDHTLTVTMTSHHPTAESARSLVDPFLRAWELDAALAYGRCEFRFDFVRSEVIDRDPPPPDSRQIMQASAMSVQPQIVSASTSVALGRYPEPPIAFAASPDVETLWHRYEGYLAGREPLLAMAYFCLSGVQWLAGSRTKAAARFNVCRSVLDRLGDVTSLLGDERTARKFVTGSDRRPLTPQEERWVEATVKMLIRRVAEYAADPDAPRAQITMAELPPLADDGS